VVAAVRRTLWPADAEEIRRASGADQVSDYLLANGVIPHLVGELTIDDENPAEIEVLLLRLNDQGRPYVDEATGERASERRTVRVLTPPPVHWFGLPR